MQSEFRDTENNPSRLEYIDVDGNNQADSFFA